METLPRRQLLQAGGVGFAAWALGGCRAPEPVRVGSTRSEAPPREAAATEHPPPPANLDSPPGLLPLPDLSDARVTAFRAGLRPYRSRGPRVQAEDRAGRLLVHDYGHGGAGLTLAFGCALDVRDLVRGRLDPGSEVVVVGGGVAGLTAARALLQVGFGVRVLARDFPPNTTSDVAGGQFSPSLMGRPAGGDLERWLRGSHAVLSGLAGAEWGVREIDNYTTSSGGHGLDRIPRELLPRIERLDALPFPGPPRRGSVYRTLIVEPPTFLPRLVEEIHDLGGVLEEHTLASAEELDELEADAIVLCTGLGTRELVEGTGLTAVRGQLVHLEPQDLGYLLSHSGYLFSRSDALVLGGTVERGVELETPDEGTCRRILERHRAFFG